jgi:hypothetical protein
MICAPWRAGAAPPARSRPAAPSARRWCQRPARNQRQENSRPAARPRAFSRIASCRWAQVLGFSISSGFSPFSRARRMRASGRSGVRITGPLPVGRWSVAQAGRRPEASSRGRAGSGADRPPAPTSPNWSAPSATGPAGRNSGRQFAQPVGAVQIGPFGALHRQRLAQAADLALQRAHLFQRGLGGVILAVGPEARRSAIRKESNINTGRISGVLSVRIGQAQIGGRSSARPGPWCAADAQLAPSARAGCAAISAGIRADGLARHQRESGRRCRPWRGHSGCAASCPLAAA